MVAANVIGEQWSSEVDKTPLRAVEKALDVDEVLTLDGRLLLGHAQPSADIGRGLWAVTDVRHGSEVTPLGGRGSVPPTSMEAAVELLLRDAVRRSRRR